MLAEKFQITVPYSQKKDDDGDKWAEVNSVHVQSNCVMEKQESGKFNQMPVGYDATSSKDSFVQGFGGDTDVTWDIGPESLIAGYKRRELKSTDDQYSGEHIDLFYGEAIDEKGQHGFVERNNYLDRL